MTRGLEQGFVHDLKEAHLKPIYDLLTDPKLCLEIRGNYINIYYQGGNALKISKIKAGYRFDFDEKYCIGSASRLKQPIVNALKSNEPQRIQTIFPMILESMDTYFRIHPKLERDIQHDLITGSHQGLNIVDIEYRDPGHSPHTCRIDMLGVVKVDKRYRLVIIENKQGTKSIGGSSGIKKHYDDFVRLINDPIAFSRLKDSVTKIIHNKYELGTLDFRLNFEDLIDTEILFIIVDYNFRSDSIKRAVASIEKSFPANIIFMSSNDRNIPYLKATDLFNEI